MALFCVPKHLATKLKAAAQSGDINVEELFKMSSEERRAKFSQYVDEATAKEINAGFETSLSKQTIAGQKASLKSWAERTFTGQAKKSVKYKDVLDKINELDQLGALTPENERAFLQDLVATKLGATINSEEAKAISEKAKNLQDLATKFERIGDPTDNRAGQIEYFTKRREMEDYLNSLNPQSNLKILTHTIGRGNLLFRLSSANLNIISNSVTGFLETATRRVETRKLGGMNTKEALDYAKFAREIYSKSGYDITRLQSLESDKFIRGEGDQIHSQGKGIIRKIGRIHEDITFKKMQGAPDVFFASFHWADKANIESTKLALSEGLKGDIAKARASQILKDAMSITPQTEYGQLVRARATAAAEYATATNESSFAKGSLGIRKVLNTLSGDLRIGDLNMPFVKTTANYVGIGLDYSGTTLLPDVLFRGMRVIKTMKEEGFKNASKEQFSGFGVKLIRAGIGITGAYLIAQMFEPSEFIGSYPTTAKERELLADRNATPNSVLIGGKWVSLDWFGPLGSSLTGFLYAKKYGKGGLQNSAFEYSLGSIQTLRNLPGLDQVSGILDELAKTVPNGQKGIETIKADVANYLTDFVASRSIPGLIQDIAKGTDTYQRDTKDQPFGSILTKIPGIRGALPEKTTVFGDKLKEENIISDVFFGSRVKTSTDNAIVKELTRLAGEGQLPSINDTTETSIRAKKLEQAIGENRFNQAREKFGVWLKEDITDLIDSNKYRSSDDEQKKNLINNVKASTFEDMLNSFDYYRYYKN